MQIENIHPIRTTIITAAFILLLVTMQCNTAQMAVGGSPDNGSDKDIVVGSAKLTVRFEGKSPHIKFYSTTEDANTTRFYKVMYQEIEELDAEGSAVPHHSVQSLSGGTIDFEFSDVSIVELGGNTMTNVNFTANLNVAGQAVLLRISNYMTESPTVMQNGNETIEMPESSLKFNVEIYDWPFLSMDNSLRLNIRVMSNSASHRVRTRTNGSNGNVSRIELGSNTGESAFIDLAETAIADGVNVPITSLMEITGNADLSLYFPYFNESLIYDPTICLAGTTFEDDEAGFLPFSAGVMLLALPIWAAATTVYRRRRK